MNRIYKVIWSKVKNCYVVVSEIAKRNSKSTVNSGFSVTRNILAGAVVLGLTAGVCAPVWAADGKVGMYNFIGDKIYIDNSTATGERAAAFGYGTHAEGAKSFATGHNTYAYGNFSSTFGYETKAKGNDAMASGFQTIAVGPGATTWGYQTIVGTIANGYTVDYANPDLTKITAVENATAWGAQTNAAAMDATAWGYQSKATGTTSTAFGIGTLASGNQSTAFGNLTIASGQEATAFGLYTEASGLHSLAAGEGTATDHTVADGEDAVALGMQVKALGNHSIAVGRETKTYKDAQESVAMGYKSEAKQNYAFAAGNHSIADGIGAVAMGYDSTATGEAAFAVGRGANATMKGAVALGSYSVADAANNGTGGYAISGKAPGSDTPGNAGNIGQDYVWKPAGGYGNVAVGDVSGNTKITRRITGLAAGYDLTDAVNVAQLYDLRDEITSSSSDWQLADAAGVVDGKTKTPYTVKIVDGKPQVTLKVVNNKVENPAANAQEYVIDLSELPDKDTKYSGTQTVTVATNTSNGSTTFNLMEKGEDTPVPVGSMIIKAGQNVKITQEGGEGETPVTAVISAETDLSGVQLKFAGDDYKKEGETESNVVTRTNEEKLDILGGATELTDNNIGVVNEGSENSLKVKLAKDIALPDGSITITPKEGDSYTDIVIKQGDVRMGDNYITNVKNAGDKVNNDYTKTEINNYGATISDVKNIAKWDAYIKSSGETGTAVGTVDINNPYFTLQAGDNVTIVKGDETNSVKISSASFEAGDGITISKDETTNKYKISLNIEGGVTPTDKVTVEPKSSTGSETAGGETTTPGTTGGEAAGSGTSGSTEAGKAVTITSDTNSTAFTDDAGTTFVTVTPTSKDDETSAKNNLQIKGDGTNITTVATSNGQDKGGSIQVKLNSDITVDNVTVNNTVKAKTINATTIAGDTINATTVNGDTVNTQTIKLGDTTIKQGDDNRITYNTKSGDTYNIATLEDGMDFAGDDGKTIHKNLADQLDIVGGAAEKASKDNIYTYNDNGKIHINLAKDIEGVDTVTVNKTINVGGNTTITGDTITTKTVNVGDTTINNNGVTIKNGPSITKNGVDAGGKKITNVAPGTDGTDAVNVDQLNSAMNQTGGAINRLGDQISKVDNRMKKGLAGAAALAALHPLEFDPDDKLTFAAGLGNYRGENAAAIGAFYRPDEKVMFSVGGTVGNGENMVNAGISFSLDRVPHVTNTKAAMAREILDLRREVLELKASVASGNWMLDPTLTRLFPDTEENHWAYEYVKTLAGNHIIEGYPDGEFKGDQMITRYEMAAILYRAMMNGAKLPDKALNEFADELGRFRVDRIYGNGDDRHKVERIRVNDENRNDRDVYGSRYEYFNQHPGANVSTGALPGTKQAERAAKAEAAAKQNEKPSVVSHSEKAAG